MSSLFDGVAEKFTREIDEAIECDRYTRGRIIIDLARSAIRPDQEVLDFGCGPGRVSLLLARAGFRVLGVDISEGMMEQARTIDRSGLHLEFETIKTPEDALQPDSCDAIVCSSVIEYVADPGELLRQFRRAMRGTSGALIISYANKSSLWRKYWMDTGPANPLTGPYHHVWSWPEFRALLAQNGFAAVKPPVYFESPFDQRRWAGLLRHVPLVGSLGMVLARAS